MPQTTQTFNLVGTYYHVMFETPPAMPTTEQLFAHQAKLCLDANLCVQGDVDRLHDILPSAGVVLCVFRTFHREELTELMTHVVVNGNRGRNYLDFAHLTNEPWVPEEPHMLTDVRDGRHRLDFKASVNHANITRESRKGFAAIHLALWGIYHGQDTLTHHFLDGVASRYNFGDVPSLYLNVSEPELDASWLVYASPWWGAPCAGGVIVPRG